MARKNAETISVAIWVTGPIDFDTTGFSTQIKLEPTELWRCRPEVAKSNPELDRVSWIYEIKDVEAREYSKALLKILDIVSPRERPMKKLIIDLGLNVAFHLVPSGKLRGFDTTVTPDIVKKIAGIGAGIVIHNDRLK